MILGLKSPTFEADFVISTTTVDGSTQSTAMTTMMTFSAFKNQDKNGKDSEDLNEKDKTALETVNWDHDEFNSEKSVEKRLFNGNSEKQSKNSKKRSSENEGLVVPRSPESPKTKRARLILKRCFDPTFNTQMLDLGEELAANSDVDSDAET